MTDKRKLVDTKCVELAEHFLADVPDATKADIQELAEQFQAAADSFVIAADAGP